MIQQNKPFWAAAGVIAFFGCVTFAATQTVKPHTLTPGTVTPFQTVITVHIGAGQNKAPANGSATGTQAFTVPAGQRLTIETVSAYRTDPPLPAGEYDDIVAYVSTSVGGTRASIVGPDVGRDDQPAPAYGESGAMKAYADAGSAVIINGFRNTTTSPYETLYVTVSGYLTAL